MIEIAIHPVIKRFSHGFRLVCGAGTTHRVLLYSCSRLMRKFPTCSCGNTHVKAVHLILLLLVLITPAAMSEAVPSVSGSQEQHPDQCPDCSACSSPPSHARPYFRSALARSVYKKIQTDEDFARFDQNEVCLMWFPLKTKQILIENKMEKVTNAAVNEAV